MKKQKKYLLVFVIFIVLMSSILLLFMFKFTNTASLNEAKHLLKELYTLEEGHYYLKDGLIYSKDNYIISNKKFFDASGDINIDKYGNVKFLLSYEDKCISKTSLGNIELNNGVCPEEGKVEVNIIRNNKVISFSSNTKNLEYKISLKDDFSGKFIKEEYTDNLIIKNYNEGINYIWFKDKDGNLSQTYTFNVECLYTTKSEYDESVFYCSSSVVTIDSIEWIVLKDSIDNIKLIKKTPLEEKMSLCSDIKGKFCFYNKDKKNTYTWGNSYINYYLNTVFVDKLSNKIKDKLLDNEICTEEDNFNCGDESCIGRSVDEIEYNDYKCTKYESSKIKLISYDEFNYAVYKAKNIDTFSGNYYAINTLDNENATSIQLNNDFYILEDFTNKLDIKPVIWLSKTNK